MLEELALDIRVVVETGSEILTMLPEHASVYLRKHPRAQWIPCYVVSSPALAVYQTVRVSGMQRGRDYDDLYGATVDSLHRTVTLPLPQAMAIGEQLVRDVYDAAGRIEKDLLEFAMRGIVDAA